MGIIRQIGAVADRHRRHPQQSGQLHNLLAGPGFAPLPGAALQVHTAHGIAAQGRIPGQVGTAHQDQEVFEHLGRVGVEAHPAVGAALDGRELGGGPHLTEIGAVQEIPHQIEEEVGADAHDLGHGHVDVGTGPTPAGVAHGHQRGGGGKSSRGPLADPSSGP